MRYTVFSFALTIITHFVPNLSNAVEYYCSVALKRDYDHIYSDEDLRKWRWGVKITESGNDAIMSRCSISSSTNSLSCDDYRVDYMHSDPYTGTKKYYYFRGHFDVQLFPDLSFIENNGRGSIARGQCSVIKP